MHVMATFKPDTPKAVIDAAVTSLRQHRWVEHVEFVLDPAPIRTNPPEDDLVDTTVRGGHAYLKGPGGELLERLTEVEKDVVDLLVMRVRHDLGPVETQKGLLDTLQTFRPERWATKKGVASATDAYAALRTKLAGTGWDLVDEAGTYHFKRFHDPRR